MPENRVCWPGNRARFHEGPETVARGVSGKKAFLKSFVERIEMGESEAKVIYAIPMPPSNLATETIGVLPLIQNGRPCRIRTCDRQIKSLLLCQLS